MRLMYRLGQYAEDFVTSEPAIDKVCIRRISTVYGILNGASYNSRLVSLPAQDLPAGRLFEGRSSETEVFPPDLLPTQKQTFRTSLPATKK